jgi:glycosyltransferase involved in cell wall biosynthesis
MNNITVIIPIRNEIKHIERSVKSALRLTQYVYVVDSGSTDGSIELAVRLGARVFQYEWTKESNFSKKINWALENLPIKTTWAIRLDADEYFMDNAIESLPKVLENVDNSINGFTLIRRVYFMGKWIKHSKEYPKTTMRVYRVGHVRMESRWLDEHIDIGEGKAVNLPLDIVDDSKITIAQWVNKHNNDYSIKEAIELIHQEIGLFDRAESHLDKNAQKKKDIKQKYVSMPKYWRCFIWFCYREFIKLGFLDGKEGFLWNFFQGWWYRMLVDAKVDEIYKNCGKDKYKIAKYVLDTYNLDISKG